MKTEKRFLSRFIPAALRLVAFLAVLCLSLAAGSASAGSRLMVVSDLHYLAPELYRGSGLFLRSLRRGDGKLTQYGEELLAALYREIKSAALLNSFGSTVPFQDLQFLSVSVYKLCIRIPHDRKFRILHSLNTDKRTDVILRIRKMPALLPADRLGEARRHHRVRVNTYSLDMLILLMFRGFGDGNWTGKSFSKAPNE